jgi:hypothetical protein
MMASLCAFAASNSPHSTFPRTGKTGGYRPGCPSSRGSEGQFYQKIARIKTKSGNLRWFSCIVSQLAFSYPFKVPPRLRAAALNRAI